MGEAIERLEQDIDSLVAELVAAAGRYDDGVVGKFLTEQLAGYVQHHLAGLLAFGSEGCTLGHEVVLETVDRDDIGLLLEQLCALTVGNLTYRGEAVDTMGSLLLDRVLRLHIELIGHLVAIVALHIVVEGLHVAGDRAAYRCCVGGKYRSDRGNPMLEEKGTKACHPLVCLVDYLGQLTIHI